MRYLSANLLAAQKQLKVKPATRLILRDYLGLDVRLHWASLYTGSEPAAHHDACQASDGSIVRVRRHSDGNLYYQRVTDPTNAAQWAAWTDSGLAIADQPIALCASATSAVVWMFFMISGNDFRIRGKPSSDYGATFGSAEIVANMASGTITSLAADMKGDVPYVVFAHDPGGAGSDDDLYITYKNGSWAAPAGWGKTPLWKFWGVSIVKETDFEILFCARSSGTGKPWQLYSIVYGDGVDVAAGTWADPVIIEPSGLEQPYQYKWPSLRYLDVYRATYIGRYTGISPVVERAHFMRVAQGADYISSYWTEPRPSAKEASYGLKLAYDSPSQYVYLISHDKAWRAPVSGLASVTLSARVVHYKYDLPWFPETGGPVYEAVIELDNSDGALDNAGVADDTYEVIKPGSIVELSPGYDYQGTEYFRQLPAMWVEEVSHHVDRRHGSKHLHLRCLSWWGLAERWTARRIFQWVDGDKNCFQILTYLMGRIGGIDFSTTGEASSTLANWYPAFLIKPGEQGREAIVRFLAKIPDVLYSDLGVVYAKELDPAETSDYEYGGSGEHPILEGFYTTSAPRDNRSEVFGLTCFGTDADFDEVEQMGHRLLKVIDEAYETNAEALAEATAVLRKVEVAESAGWIRTMPNCGIELFDVITITDPSVGISGLLKRVTRIELEYDSRGVKPGRPKPIYTQTLHLGPR